MKALMLAVSLAAFAASSERLEPVNAQPAGNLKAYVAVSDSTKFIQDWTTMSSETPVTIQRRLDYMPGEVMHIAILVTGFERNPEGILDLSADLVIQKPDGSVLFDLKEYAKLRAPVPPQPTIVMLDPALDLGFDDTDAIGTYGVRATVRDQVGSNMIMAEEHITLSPLRSEAQDILQAPVNSPKVLDKLWAHYYSTQDAAAVQRVISVIHLVEEGSGTEILIGGVAQLSLMDYAYKDPDVLRICKNALESSTGATRTALHEVLDKVREKKVRFAE